jgi:hypothetical protein
MKNILIITYYWPPSGAAAVQRWLKIAITLKKIGHNPVVITTQNGDYPQIDNSLLDLIPKNLKVIKTTSVNYGSAFRIFTGERKLPYGNMTTTQKDSIIKKIFFWIRMNLIVPDARIGWFPFAYRAAKKEVRLHKFDLVVTTGPPHSSHIIGYFLKKKFGIKWISDFRDPWTNIIYNQKNKRNKLIVQIDKMIENKIVANSDYTFLVSKEWINLIPKGNVVVMPNAFMKSEFENLEFHKSKFFRIKYIGKLIDFDHIEDVLEQIGEFSRTNPNIELSFIGDYGCLTDSYRNKYRNIKYVRKNFIPHKDAIQEMYDSEMLILLINEYSGNKGLVPSKIFEYIATRTFILGYGPNDGDAAKYINETHSGIMINYGEIDNIYASLKNRYHIWCTNKNGKNVGEIKQFSVENQVKKILGLI